MSSQRYSSIASNEEQSRGTELAPLEGTYWKSPHADTPGTQYSGTFPSGDYTGAHYSGTYPSGDYTGAQYQQQQYPPQHPSGDYSDTEPLKPQHPVRVSQKPEHHLLHHWISEKPSILKTFAIQLFACLWLAPIGGLLYLNITNFILGASAWCPFGNCLPKVYGDYANALRLPAEFDKDSHNLLGSLQFAAKALEVWFILIVSWLVYLVTASIASRPHGLPIGYFTRPTEFAEISGLLDPLLWSTLRRPSSSRASPRRGRKRIVIFLLGTVFLCILCNLMGPAVAVLILPSLQWIDSKPFGDLTMAQLNYDKPPALGGFAYWDSGDGCTDNVFSIANFSCSTWWSMSVDSWMDGYLAAQNGKTVLSTQDIISFSYNNTIPSELNGAHSIVNWAPSRMMMQNISNDLGIIQFISMGVQLSDLGETDAAAWIGDNTTVQEQYDAFIPYAKTVQTYIVREGPILGASANLWSAYNLKDQWTTRVDSSRSVRCYASWNITNTPLCWGDCDSPDFGNYTRCIAIGTGWNDGYKNANFSVEGQYATATQDLGPSLDFQIHLSGKAAFLKNGVLPAGFDAACLTPNDKNVTVPANANCDWAAFFNSGQDEPRLQTRGRNVTTWEINFSAAEDGDHPTSVTLAVDFSVYQAFASYSLDSSRITNKLAITTFELMLPKDGSIAGPLAQAVPIDPTWSLAAWAADAGGLMPNRRPAASLLIDFFNNMWNDYADPQPLYNNHNDAEAVTLMPIIQLLSTIDHTTTPTANTDASKQDPAHPLLQVHGRLYVWAYGLSSRTSYFGVFVAACGGLVVILEIIVGFADRRRFRSPTQLLVAALEHNYQGEFRDVRDEKTLSRMMFRLSNDPYSAGRFKFEKTM